MRALIVTRLSKLTDATTSPERQESLGRSFCDARDWSVVGVTCDLNVSRDVSPFDRPDLRPWLIDRSNEFDVIVCYRTDRVVSRIVHMAQMIEWCQTNGKNLASVTEALDLSTDLGQAMATMIAMFGQMELKAIQDRNYGASQGTIATGRFRGGTIPAGYKPLHDGPPNDRGVPTWRLVPDEEGLAPVMRDIVERLAGGERAATIVTDLNTRGVPTPKDRQDELAGREPKHRQWRAANFRHLVQSPTIIGQAVYRERVTDANGQPVKRNGKVQYGEERIVFQDGAPLQRAEPLVSRELWQTACRAIDDRANVTSGGKRRATEGALLTGVAECGRCGAKLYRNVRADRRDIYRCSSTNHGKACGNGTVKCETIDAAVNDYLLGHLGTLPNVERRWVAGSDNTQTLAQVDAELESYVAAIGRFPAGSPSWESAMSKVDTLTATRQRLENEPTRASGYEYVTTGETFAEYWQGLDLTERNTFLRDHGSRVVVTRDTGTEPTWTIRLGNIATMLEAVNPEHAAEVFDSLAYEVYGSDDPADGRDLLARRNRRVGP